MPTEIATLLPASTKSCLGLTAQVVRVGPALDDAGVQEIRRWLSRMIHHVRSSFLPRRSDNTYGIMVPTGYGSG
jgi:hypothetical protein